MLNDVLEWHPNPGPQEHFHSSPAFEVLYGGAAGGGKFLSIRTPIWTNYGWKTIGTLTTEDLIVTEDGTWAESEYISDILVGRKCYELAFSNGEKIVADSTHLWNVVETIPYNEQHRHRTKYAEKTLTTEQLVVEGVRIKMPGRHSADGRTKRFRLPITDGCVGLWQDLRVDPYILGYWLGDGTTRTGYFTIGNQDLDDVVKIFAERGYQLVKLAGKYCYKSLGLKYSDLQGLGVTRDRNETRRTRPEVKHIPMQYFQASRQQRLELLRGLMDSDGHCQARGRCEFCSTESRLADDFCTLLATLGFKYSRTLAPTILNGKSLPSHRITFTPRTRVFNIVRKGRNQILTPPSEYDAAVWIESIEETESVPVQCIRVKHSSHTFLAGRTMIPTHNSESLLVEALRYIGHSGYSGILFRRTFPELKQARGLIERSRLLYPKYDGRYNEQMHMWRFSSGATITFAHIEHEDDKYDHQSAEYAYIGFDELTTFTETQYLYLFSRARNPFGIPTRVRAASNPGNVGHEWVRERWGPWIKREESTDTPRLKPEEIRYFKRVDDVDIECSRDDPDALSRQFIPAKLHDNPALIVRDPTYEAKLKAMPLIDRQRLLNGDWDLLIQGNVFKSEWFKRIGYVPIGLRWFRYWDLASSVRTAADFTASACGAMNTEANLYLRDMIRMKAEWPDVRKVIVDTMLAEPNVIHGIEKASYGLAAFQDLMNDPELAGIKMISVDVDKDKLSRALPVSQRAEQGKVYLVDGPWVPGYLVESSIFDGLGKAHDDQVDAVSGVNQMIVKPKWRQLKFAHL